MKNSTTFFVIGCFLFLPFIRFVIDYFKNDYSIDIYFASALLPLVIMIVGSFFMLISTENVADYVKSAWEVKDENGKIAKQVTFTKSEETYYTSDLERIYGNMLMTCFVYGIVLLIPTTICLLSFIFGDKFGIDFKYGDHIVGSCFVVIFFTIIGVILLLEGVHYFYLQNQQYKNNYQ